MSSLFISKEEYLDGLNLFFDKLLEIYRDAEKFYQRELQHFFEAVKFQYSIYKIAEERFNYQFGASFNVIDLFQPDEPKLSKIIAEFLDPKGIHGQRDVFLKIFLKKIKDELLEKFHVDKNYIKWLDDIDCEKVKVSTEFVIHGGRIDIFLEITSTKVIAIENKPWAEEQEDQLSRYRDYLENNNSNYLLIFLGEEGREAYSLKEKEKLRLQGKFLEISYNRFLKEWLKDCIKNCEPEKVRFFLKDFLSWVEKTFPERI